MKRKLVLRYFYFKERTTTKQLRKKYRNFAPRIIGYHIYNKRKNKWNYPKIR